MEVKIKGMKNIEENLMKALNGIKNDPATMNKLGTIATTKIKDFVEAGADEYKVLPVSKTTEKIRKELSKYNQTDSTYRKSKALVFTGELINSLTFEIKDTVIKLFFKGTHSAYKGEKGPIGLEQPNSVIAQKVQKQRPFLFLSERIKKQMENELVREIRRKISEYQKLRRRIDKS